MVSGFEGPGWLLANGEIVETALGWPSRCSDGEATFGQLHRVYCVPQLQD